MARSRIITGLDVGTNSIKCLVVEQSTNAWNVLSYVHIPSFGLRRGIVSNVEETARSIQLLLAETERNCGRKVNSVFVNIGGSHLYTLPSDGLISVSRADHIISQEDVDRVLQATRAINIPMNEEVLDVFPREFIIDDQKGIRQPLGLHGVRLQTKVVLLCYFQQHFINLTQAVLNARLQIDDVIPSPLAAAESTLSKQQKEIGAAVIDIGSATTSLAVFDEGDLIHMAIFPLGSSNITYDLAIGLRTEVPIAEDIKKQHGACLLSPGDKDKKSQVEQKRSHVIKMKNSSNQADNKVSVGYGIDFGKKDLVNIIEPRVSEILDLMYKELKKIGRQELLPGGITLTGGGSKIPKIIELAKDRLRLPCSLGIPSGITGLPDDPALATVAGLIMNSPDFSNEDNKRTFHFSGGLIKGWGSALKRMFRVFIP
jgi:cell division protein FtsA